MIIHHLVAFAALESKLQLFNILKISPPPLRCSNLEKVMNEMYVRTQLSDAHKTSCLELLQVVICSRALGGIDDL